MLNGMCLLRRPTLFPEQLGVYAMLIDSVSRSTPLLPAFKDAIPTFGISALSEMVNE